MALTKQEASEAVESKLTEIKKLLKEATELADENGLTFYWGSPTGSIQYYGKGAEVEGWDIPYDWRPEDVDGNEIVTIEEGMWVSSSDRC